MRAIILSIVLAVTVSTGVAVSAANAQGNICFRLWVARNSIYKAYGYCFKTARAIAYFGNAGCRYTREGDIPMSRADQVLIARILREERVYGCR